MFIINISLTQNSQLMLKMKLMKHYTCYEILLTKGPNFQY